MDNALLRISGSIEIGRPLSKQLNACDLQKEIAAFLGRRTESRILKSSPTIWLERGYHLWPHSPDVLATFEPVEISVQVSGDYISLHYTLGLRPLYLGLAVFLSSLGILSIHYAAGLEIILALYSAIAIITVAAVLIRIRQFRLWLTDATSSILNFAEEYS